MTCPACTAAEREPRTAMRTNGCRGCLTRMLAATGAHLESKAAGRMTQQYEGALRERFADDWMAAHEQIKQWASRMGQSQ